MKTTLPRLAAVAAALLLAFAAGAMVAQQAAPPPLRSAIVPQGEAVRQDNEWGTLYTYYAGETFGTRDVLAAVAVIKPGWEIHPPHEHPEEEYVMVTQGTGVWHMNGKEIPARPGDMQYAAPWDVHGIRNTGSTPLTFVVWKWNNKGVEIPAKPRAAP